MADTEGTNWLPEAHRLDAEGVPHAEIARAVGQSRALIHYHLGGGRENRQKRLRDPERRSEFNRYQKYMAARRRGRARGDDG